MASLYKRSGSPFWWVKFKADDGKIVRRSLHIRHGTRSRDTAARRELEVIESAEADKPADSEHFLAWVPDFIASRYDNELSLSTVQRRWRTIWSYLQPRGLLYPQQLTFEHCVEYVKWRQDGDKATGIRPATRGTAVDEMRCLGMLLGRAVRLGYVQVNVALKLGISKSKPREKPEFTDTQITAVWKELRSGPEWMRTQWLICLNTGCRSSEARIPMSRVNIEGRTICLHAKGNAVFTVPMREELAPLFCHLRDRGEEYTLDFPPGDRGKVPVRWRTFFDRLGLDKHCLHCLRNTFITRGIRAGIPENQMMLLVHHASVTISRLYQRLGVADVRASLASIPLPQLDYSGTPDGPSASPAVGGGSNIVPLRR